MAIAPLEFDQAPAVAGARAGGLRLVTPQSPLVAPVVPLRACRGPVPAFELRHGVDVCHRGASRRRTVVRRRRVALAVLTVGLLVGLGLPVGALGGRAPSTAGAAASLPGAADGGTGVVYVVPPGGTLASIAARIDPAHPVREARLLARQTGSSTVVPGEHLTLP